MKKQNPKPAQSNEFLEYLGSMKQSSYNIRQKYYATHTEQPKLERTEQQKEALARIFGSINSKEDWAFVDTCIADVRKEFKLDEPSRTFSEADVENIARFLWKDMQFADGFPKKGELGRKCFEEKARALLSSLSLKRQDDVRKDERLKFAEFAIEVIKAHQTKAALILFKEVAAKLRKR